MERHCAADHSVASWKKSNVFINNAILQMNVTYVSIHSQLCRFEIAKNMILSYIYARIYFLF